VGELVERKGKKGLFYGCSHYPACRHTQNENPAPESLKPEAIGGRRSNNGTK
jgi:ssDNA-binding Zn-finger/Zn-ribbon topoisomerase 1